MAILKNYQDLVQLPISQIRKLYGGKALGLFESYRLGLPVPEAYMLGTDYYEDFLAQNLQLKHADFKNKAYTFLNQLLSEQLSQLPDQLYAVRSSSQNEDSSAHSYAGIFESRLDIPKIDLIAAIADVWDSCFSVRAAAYLKGEIVLRMGVIIQPMIKAKYAGVCFSRHPSPANVFENQHIVIEFAPCSGEQIVQGEITPFLLSGKIDDLSQASDAPWIDTLLKTLLSLKNAYHHEIDMEFAVDEQERFWLLQQRPVSKLAASHLLDLKSYQRKYKRSLHSLDVELLIDGCSQFLAPYLEVPFQFDRWMIMITGADGQQELWVHTLLDEAAVSKIAVKALSEEGYLTRLETRYLETHQKILNHSYSVFFDQTIPLFHRFFQWTEFMIPLWAHYYAPMFLIESLHRILLEEMNKIDSDYANNDLFFMGTFGIATLSDLLNQKLAELKSKMGSLPSLFTELSSLHQQTLTELADQFGFLKCHQITERGYSPEEMFKMLSDLPEESKEEDEVQYRKLCKKYLLNDQQHALFESFKRWMRFRNQEMEFVISAIVRSRPLSDEICTTLGISIEQFFNSSKELIAKALKTQNPTIALSLSHENLVIYRSYGKTRLYNNIQIQGPQKESGKGLKGKTVFGQGQLKAKVKIAFKPQELEKISQFQEPHVLVTGMTTPDFIPHLQKNFSALITDEGGILCHAAIVAREIQMPCIVGTGIATEKLKDEMMLKIDFDRGEIEEITD
jgi:phosphoenolpyruvate synthase/pyruvate phosphate dikinase